MLFEFPDPCDTCPVPLDSPRCESCALNLDNWDIDKWGGGELDA